MLKRIAVDQLEIGMFVHKMEGNWFSHPFWKAKFLIDDNERLNTLRSSGLQGVEIDTSRGKDVATAKASHSQSRSAPPAGDGAAASLRVRKVAQRATNRTDPVSTEVELQAAQAIAARAQKALHNTFFATRLGRAINVRTVQPVVSDILDSVRRNPQAFGGLMRCKLKNEVIYQHSLAVSALMVALARRMKLSQAEAQEAGLAGLLLDIGVNYLPQNLDVPNNDYRNLEPKIWQQHVMLGYRALDNDGTFPDAVPTACLEHHERMDGTGFPKNLKADEISTIGRMAAICDTFDFMLTGTSTSRGLDPAAAVLQMQQMEGAFDVDILRMFIETVGLYPIGSFVDLQSGKIALVVDEHHTETGKPVVQAFFSRVTGERITPHRIELARAESNDVILGIADLDGLNLPDTDQLRELVFMTAHRLA